MRVRLKTLYAGPSGIIQPGALVTLPEEEAGRLVSSGYASPEFAPRPAVEAATLPAAPETTQRTNTRARPGKK